jgi:hypothetical protein
LAGPLAITKSGRLGTRTASRTPVIRLVLGYLGAGPNSPRQVARPARCGAGTVAANAINTRQPSRALSAGRVGTCLPRRRLPAGSTETVVSASRIAVCVGCATRGGALSRHTQEPGRTGLQDVGAAGACAAAPARQAGRVLVPLFGRTNGNVRRLTSRFLLTRVATIA